MESQKIDDFLYKKYDPDFPKISNFFIWPGPIDFYNLYIILSVY